MSVKINVFKLITEHFKTLRDDRTNRMDKTDITVFFFLPLFLSSVSVYTSFELNDKFIEAIINFGAIYSALLMSVLVLVYDQDKKLSDKIDSLSDDKNNGEALHQKEVFDVRKNLLKQLYHNICFSIASSLFIVGFALCHIVLLSLRYSVINQILIDPIIIFLIANMFLTTFMIVKRMHALLETE